MDSMLELLKVLKIFTIPAVLVPSIIIWIVSAIIIVWALIRDGRRTRKILEKALGVSDQTWWLVHGGKSDFYYDLDKKLTMPETIRLISRWYAQTISEIDQETKIDRLVFVEKDSGPVGALSLKDTIILETAIPGIIVRTRRRIWVNAIEGEFPIQSGENVVIVTDVVTTGGSVRKALRFLKLWDLNPVAVVAIVNRTDKDYLEIFDHRIDLKYRTDEKETDELRKRGLISVDNESLVRESPASQNGEAVAARY